MSLVDELVRYCAETMKVCGKERGQIYVAECLTHWSVVYGRRVADQVLAKINKAETRGKESK